MRGKRRGTTHRDNRSAAAEDLLKRNFRATEVDRVWVADITYVTSAEGFLYLAFIPDAYSRKVVGKAMESHLRPNWCSTLCRWPRGEGSRLRGWSTIPTRVPLHRALLLRKAQGGRHQPVDGKDL